MKNLSNFIIEKYLIDKDTKLEEIIANGINVMPDQEGFIEDIELKVNNKKCSEQTYQRLSKYFTDEVHLYNKEKFSDNGINALVRLYVHKGVYPKQEWIDNNSMLIQIHKYKDQYIGYIEDADNNKEYLILPAELKL